MATPTTRRELETKIVLKAIKDADFRQKLLSNPKDTVLKVIKEADPDFKVRPDMDVKVFEEPKKSFYLVLPHTPSDSVEISDEDLEKVAGGIFTDRWGDAEIIIGF